MSGHCSICNKEYKSKRSLYNHNNRKHNTNTIITKDISNNTIEFLCEICNTEFKHGSSLSRHKKKCKQEVETNTLIEKVTQLENKINELSNTIQPVQQNITQINIQNNYINYTPPTYISNVYDNQIYKKITHNDYMSHIYSPDKCMMLRNFTTYMYTTNNLNEHKNIYIPTITNNDIVYRFNAKSNTFIESNKVKTIDEFIRSNMACIENLVYEYDDDQYDNVLEFFNALIESTRQYNIIHNDIYIIIRNANEIVKHNFDEYIRKQNAEKAIENETENNTLIVKKKKKTVEKREEIIYEL